MRVASEFVDVPAPGGKMRTAVLRPANSDALPALVFFSDIFQLTPSTLRMATRFASYGFLVAAPEMYYRSEPPGTAFPFDDAGRERGIVAAKKTKAADVDADISALVDWVRVRPDVAPGEVGAVGFCFGGHVAFRAARNPHVRTTVCYYPTGLSDGALGSEADAGSLQRAGEIHGSLLLVFGTQDPHVPFEARIAVASALASAGTNARIAHYEAEHAFMRDEGPRSDPELADRAFAEGVSALRLTLATGAPSAPR